MHTDHFEHQYRCYSGAFIGKTHIDEGGKVILPNSAVEELAHLHIVYPMMFQLLTGAGIRTHCGVLEFSAPEGHIYIPFWMMQHLQLQPGQLITVRNTSLPRGTFVKIRPQSKDFIEDISNPRAVLEAKLRNFSALTRGDTILIMYNEKQYCIDILEVKSARGVEAAISIVEADIQVDFDRPPDLPDSPRQPVPSPTTPVSGGFSFARAHSGPGPAPPAAPVGPPVVPAKGNPTEEKKFVPFTGTGRTLSGKVLQ